MKGLLTVFAAVMLVWVVVILSEIALQPTAQGPCT
jgi:hypothetical protein